MSEELLNEQLNDDPAYNDPKYPIQKIAIGQNAEGAPTPITYIDHSKVPRQSGLEGDEKIGKGDISSVGAYYESDQILSTAVSGDNVNYFWDRNGRLIAGSCDYNASVAGVRFGGPHQEGGGPTEGNALLAKTTKDGTTATKDGYAISSYNSPTSGAAYGHPGTMKNMTRWTLQVNAADEVHRVEDTGKYIEFDGGVSPQSEVEFQKLPIGYYGNIEGFDDNGVEVIATGADMARIEITGLDPTKIAIGTTYFGVAGEFAGRLAHLDDVTQYFNETQIITPQSKGLQDVDGFDQVDVKATELKATHTGTEEANYVYTYYIGEIKNVTP